MLIEYMYIFIQKKIIYFPQIQIKLFNQIKSKPKKMKLIDFIGFLYPNFSSLHAISSLRIQNGKNHHEIIK